MALLEQRNASAFLVTSVLILASLVVPVGLEPLTDLSWVSGLVLIALAVVSVAAGLVGLYPRVNNRTPKLALAGVGAATVAGVAALGLVGLTGVAVWNEFDFGLIVANPMRVFMLVGLLIAGGFSLSLLLFGAAVWKTESSSRTVGGLLIVGGGALLAPVAVELLGLLFEVNAPAWLLFPVIGGLALDTAAVGYSLRIQRTSSK
ncbi:hypothetical protein [Halegenticoccus soli]|uniref:hypothetical protein n=1 Tax=Halegenticoccus soli TaxID=1985678 RepID=UPI00117BC9C0|nr:hypothetical protein [Halegenticoccus soli]